MVSRLERYILFKRGRDLLAMAPPPKSDGLQPKNLRVMASNQTFKHCYLSADLKWNWLATQQTVSLALRHLSTMGSPGTSPIFPMFHSCCIHVLSFQAKFEEASLRCAMGVPDGPKPSRWTPRAIGVSRGPLPLFFSRAIFLGGPSPNEAKRAKQVQRTTFQTGFTGNSLQVSASAE